MLARQLESFPENISGIMYIGGKGTINKKNILLALNL